MQSRILVTSLRISLIFLVLLSSAMGSTPVDSLRKMYRESGSKIKRVDILNEMSAQYLEVTPDSALFYARKAQVFSQKWSYQYGEAMALMQAGLAQKARGKYEAAIELYRGAISLLDHKLYPHQKAEGYAELGRCLAQLSDLDEAIAASRQAFDLYQPLDSDTEISQVANEIGFRFWRLGEYDSALVYYHRSLEIREHLPNRRNIAKTVNNIGVIYYQLGKYNRALEYYFRSLKIQQEIDNTYGISLMLSNIGKAYQDLERHQDALYYFREALALGKSVDDHSAIAYSLNNIGTTYDQIGQYDSSLAYFQRSLSKYTENEDVDGIVLNLNSIGNNYTFLGEYDIALRYLWEAHSTADSVGHVFGVATALKNMGAVYQQRNDTKQALKHYQGSMALCKELGKLEMLKNIYLELSKVYEDLGEYPESLRYYKLFVKLKDDLFGEQVENNIDKLKIIYEAEKKEQENETLRHREQQQDKIIARNKAIIIIGSIALFLIVVFAFFLNYLNLSRKKAIKLLTTSEEKYRLLVEKSNDAIVISQQEHFIYFNQQFAQMLGYSISELKQKHYQDIYAEEGLRIIKARNALRDEGVEVPDRYETVFKKKDSSPVDIEASVAIIDYQGKKATFAVLRDITERKFSEGKLHASLQEKTVLLQEIQHRTKNNMNVIIALLNMQSRESNIPELQKAFQVTQERIAAMSLVYDQLQQNDNMAAIDLNHYLQSLIQKLSVYIAADSDRIKLVCKSDQINLPLTQAVPIGIIMNEIITNAIKYAFPDETSGSIIITARLKGESRVVINVSDDGIGMSGEMIEKGMDSLGLRLVDLLVHDQLGGKHEIISVDGIHHTIEFELIEN